MNDIAKLFELDFSSTFLSVFIIIIGMKAIISALEWLFNKCGIEFKWMRKKNDDHDLLINTSDKILHLERQREVDVTESILHDQAIRDDLTKVSDAVNKISQKLDEMESKNDLSEMARLKDRIAQSYRYYSSAKQWTKMEEEAFRELIMDYESHGGKNSFVHTICEPESYTWKTID